MFENPFVQFVIELIRAFLIDELSGRVRLRFARWLGWRGPRDSRRAILCIHRRNRDRLLHRLLTELKDDL